MIDYDPYKELRKTLMSTLVIIKMKNAKIVELTKEVISLKKDKEYYKNSRDEFVNRCDEQKAEIERLKDENYHLRGYSDSIVKRKQHLFQSEIIRQFDEIDRRTYQYKKDVSKFDEEFKRYKEAFELKNIPAEGVKI